MVRIPSTWLLHRFVRPSTAPAHTYRVILIVPPGAKQARVAQSSGLSDVDELAGDYALVSIENNAPLKALAKSKELYFHSWSLRQCSTSKCEVSRTASRAPRQRALHTKRGHLLHSANQNETTSRRGKLVVIFPAQGGYASEALVTLSTGNPAWIVYYLHTAALNWQTTRKSSRSKFFEPPLEQRRRRAGNRFSIASSESHRSREI